MAREIRDADAIGKTGVYFNETCKELITVKKSFVDHINNMLVNYNGVDATSIANTLTNAINKIDGLIKNLSYYSEYMIAVAKYDTENIENATKKIRQKNTLQPNYTGGEVLDESEQIKY